MNVKRLLLFLLLVCSYDSLLGLPAQVIMIRHAEKSTEGTQLNLKGQERTAAFVPYFLGDPEVLEFGTPIEIFAVKPSQENGSTRCIETVTPLANRLQQTVTTTYEADQYAKLVAEIKQNPKYEGKMVLICWEHKVLPDMARAFGTITAPEKWLSDVYDRLWKITYNSEATITFEDHSQRLMYGDSHH